MKNVVAILAAIAISAYAIDHHYYKGYYSRNVGNVSWQVASAFGFRW